MLNPFVSYKDIDISLQIPHYLKKRKKNRFFVADNRLIDTTTIESMSVDILAGPENFLRIQSNLLNAPESDWNGVQQQAVHRNPVKYQGEGYEVLWRYTNTSKKLDKLAYDLVICIAGKVIWLSLRGDQSDNFYTDCLKIVGSVEISNKL